MSNKKKAGMVVAPIIAAASVYIYFSTLPETNYEVLRVIDGDTIEFKADFLPNPLEKKLALRVQGVDTPEKYRPQCDKEKQLALKASAFTQKLIDNASKIEIYIHDWGKFGGRVIGDIFIDGKSLADELIKNNYAVKYDGGKKIKDWCNE